MMMKRHDFLKITVSLLVLSLPLVAAAEDFDGAKALVCAAVLSAECSAGETECFIGAPWMINLPVFMKVDFNAKQVTTTKLNETTRTSAIRHVDQLAEGGTAIHGSEANFVWSMLVAHGTGNMTLSITGEGVGYIAFGACQPGK